MMKIVTHDSVSEDLQLRKKNKAKKEATGYGLMLSLC